MFPFSYFLPFQIQQVLAAHIPRMKRIDDEEYSQAILDARIVQPTLVLLVTQVCLQTKVKERVLKHLIGFYLLFSHVRKFEIWEREWEREREGQQDVSSNHLERKKRFGDVFRIDQLAAVQSERKMERMSNNERHDRWVKEAEQTPECRQNKQINKKPRTQITFNKNHNKNDHHLCRRTSVLWGWWWKVLGLSKQKRI